jgi:alkylation response protein AidB-like acyl-CoA dehydrogenase
MRAAHGALRAVPEYATQRSQLSRPIGGFQLARAMEFLVIRHMNNLESLLTYEGTPEMQTMVIGQAMTGQAACR